MEDVVITLVELRRLDPEAYEIFAWELVGEYLKLIADGKFMSAGWRVGYRLRRTPMGLFAWDFTEVPPAIMKKEGSQ